MEIDNKVVEMTAYSQNKNDLSKSKCIKKGHKSY